MNTDSMWKISAFLLAVVLLAPVVNPAVSGQGPYPPVHPNNGTLMEYTQLPFNIRTLTQDDIPALMLEWGVRESGRNYNTVLNGHGTGDAPPTLEEYGTFPGRMLVYEESRGAAFPEMPAVVDHSLEGWFPPIGDQGSQGSCAAWNIGYYIGSYLQRKDNNWTNGTNLTQLLSPAWVYNMNNYGVDMGTNREYNVELISSVGCADMATMSYSAGDYRSWGAEAAWRVAPRHSFEEYYDITDPWNTELIKYWLSQGDILSISFDADILLSGIGSEYILNSTEYVHTSSNHAVTIVGYNDTIVNGNDAGAFRIANSWGKNWGKSGYFWMTYDALGEITDRDIIRVHDRADYEPELLAIINQSVPGSRDSRIDIGTNSGKYQSFRPFWNAHQALSTVPAFPAFIALDITALKEDLGLAGYWMQMGTGRSATATVARFGLEWYPDGFEPNVSGSSVMMFNSTDTPKTAPATLNVPVPEDIHTSISFPQNGTWAGADVKLRGTISPRINRSVFSEDFENIDVSGGWTFKDLVLTGAAYNGWGVSENRFTDGERSIWSAGSDDGLLFSENFNGAWPPAGWTVVSDGPSNFPFARSNSLPRGCSSRDYLAHATSARGFGTDLTEHLRMSAPVNASSHLNIVLQFYLDFRCGSGDDWVEASYATDASYPLFSTIRRYTADTLGYQRLNLSALDHSESVYIEFVYHGTNDNYAAIDDVVLLGNKTCYDNNVNAVFEKSFSSISGLDGATLEYSCHVDTQDTSDYLTAYYKSGADPARVAVGNVTGAGQKWTENSSGLPANATAVGFLFHSNASGTAEGVYIDNLRLTGYTLLDDVCIRIDNDNWTHAGNSSDWSHRWDARLVTEGEHRITLRANYSGAYAYSHSHVFIDNTPPSHSNTGHETMYTGDRTSVRLDAWDLRGIGTVRLVFAANGAREQVLILSDHSNDTWKGSFTVPDDAAKVVFYFIVEDAVGNIATTIPETVRVIDNDAPLLDDDTTPSFATTGDELTFSATAHDNIGVSSVELEYWSDGRAHNIITGKENFNHTTITGNSNQTLHYTFSATDCAGNRARMAVKDIIVQDNDCPIISDRTPMLATTGETFQLACRASDNIGLSSVEASYWFGNGTAVSRPLAGGPVFSLDVDIPHSLRALSYCFQAKDISGNIQRTAARTVRVVDNDPPQLVEDLTPGIAFSGETLTFDIAATDNIAVAAVELVLQTGDGLERVPLPYSGKLEINIPGNSIQDIRYTIIITDSSGNFRAFGERTIDVTDRTLPIFGADLSDTEATTGDDFKFAIPSRDNIGIERVDVYVRFGDGAPLVLTLAGEDVFTTSIVISASFTGQMSYHFRATDSCGNSNATQPVTVMVRDNDPPLISEILAPERAQAKENTTIVIRALDNAGIDSITIEWISGCDLKNTSATAREDLSWVWSSSFARAGVLRYRIVATDNSGNTAQSPERELTVTLAPAGGLSGGGGNSTTVWLAGAFTVVAIVLLAIAIAHLTNPGKKR